MSDEPSAVRVGVVLAALLVSSFSALGAPSVALPVVATSPRVPFGETAWVLTAWALMSAVAMTLSGRIGLRSSVVTGVALIAAGSLLPAAASVFALVIAGRAIGGVGPGRWSSAATRAGSRRGDLGGGPLVPAVRPVPPDVEEMLAERGVTVNHVTVYRWFVDETYLKVAGKWTYLYRAVDQHGQVHDVLPSPVPAEVTTDRAPVSPRVLDELVPSVLHTVERHANNCVEAAHRRLKARLRPMRGLKRRRSAQILAAGHAFVQKLVPRPLRRRH